MSLRSGGFDTLAAFGGFGQQLHSGDYLTVGVTTLSVVLFALAERPQLSPVSHLQDGGGSFNLTSREEFARCL